MGFFDLFRHKTPIGARPASADFVDWQAVFLAQKGIYEHSRARAGPYSKMLFNEPAFIDAVNRARWQAYPLAPAMVGELFEGLLRPHARGGTPDTVKSVVALVLEVFDRYPTLAELTRAAWGDALAVMEHRLEDAALHPVKPIKDIPEPFAKAYFETMPIDEQLRGQGFPTVLNYLKVTLCNIHDELVGRAALIVVTADTLAAQ
jgi:hypothetical protein